MKHIKIDIEKLVNTFFEKLKIKINSTKIIDIENNRYNIEIISDESNLIIWYHWNNLLALEKIIQNILNSKLEEKVKIKIKINDYLIEKDEILYSQIDSKIKFLLEKWQNEIKLKKYDAYERKKIHSYIAKQKDSFTTKSKWEWENRRIFLIKKDIIENKKETKLSIDIDSDDI